MLVRRIARPLLSAVFISGGIDALRNPAPRAQAAGPLIDKSTETLPESVTQKIPSDPETLIKINAAVQIGGGVLLATGKAPRLASLALAGSLIPTTVAGHAFWNETDPAAKAAQRTQFLKNVSLLGGLLIAAVDTEGKPSLGWRGRRAARAAQASVAAALPLGSSDDHHGPEIAEALAAAAERARVLSGEAAERGSGLLEIAKERVTPIAKVAADRGAELVDVAKDRGAEWVDVAKDRGAELVDVAKDRGPVLAEIAREKGADLATVAAERSEVAGKAARKQAEIARKQAEIAREKAELALEKARAKKIDLTH
ncbi:MULTISPECIES: DoxX family protein [Rhodococcus]|uniref:DoxX family membrane protein n=1 Tax=Rhodococcus oxybenzonivorans TaxID=1990687 RepID=A0AAE4UUW1_9NOCA|nr:MULTISPECIES: DoxX family membrane protein [Rhodococcus]MDV7244049.1 DoxX family membrane protein [Rhodococcus oxybenzonivorans]MDV7263170.1 DoxX family membrane protein [Rhodococcus oxybenzonivorans]MDV7274709.1 DoxX family membrane protein [Rhodococcus oxybenzonivorans]MDV7336022.1 DoxX family membrane protein [Rhodococcus oxybenzonivorans]MDV7345659.1 DoxX family membrane protein [Rhodococcus oxybenzonivorans]